MSEEIEFPSKLGFLLFESARWKITYGGRGGGKSENIARALIMLCRTKKLRVLCARELQNSIEESVKFLIEANIESMGYEDEFQIQKTSITHIPTGSKFFFMGLRYNINKVKSLGRIDIVWLEEADKTSKTTLDKLSPTIRGRSDFEEDKGGPFGVGPEIWCSYNPDLDTDEIYIRSVLKKEEYLPDYITDENGKKVRYAIVEKINYWDNKWFPPDLRMEMNVLKAANENRYLEVWEGMTKVVLEGAIYADELRDVLSEGRRTRVPYDPNKPVFTAWDLGFRDKTAIWFVQRIGVEYNLIDYYENSLKKIPFYIQVLQQKGYNYATHLLPHDGSHDTASNISPEKQLKAVGYTVKVVTRPAKKMIAINAVRSILPVCNFDADKTEMGWQCLSRYAYKVDPESGVFSKEPEHDTPWSHGADALTSLALSLKTEQDSKKPVREKPRIVLNNHGQNSWMRGV